MSFFRSPFSFVLLTAILLSTAGFALAPTMPGDLNGDGVTDHLDFFLFALSYDPHGRRTAAAEDLNQDFEIDQRDLFLALLGRLHRDGALPPIDPDETGSLEGFVLEDVGDALVAIPIENARVFILTSTGHRFTTATDPQGRFAAEGLPAGRASIRVEHPEHHPGYAVVEIRTGETVSVRIHLAPRLDASSSLRGKVEGAANPFVDFQQLLSGAVVRVFPIDGGAVFDNQTPGGSPREPRPHQVAFTNDQGFYEIHSLPSGSYRLVVSAIGHQSEERDIALSEGENRVEDFLLFGETHEVGELFGRVTVAVANLPETDKLVQGEGASIEFAIVSLEPLWAVVPDPALDEPNRPSFPPPAYLWTRTDSDGRYDFQGIPAGSYRISVWAEGYYPEASKLEIVSGESVEMNFQLIPIELHFGAVEGTVWGATPDAESPVPIEDALVTLVPPLDFLFPPNLSGDASVRPAQFVQSTTTDENGRYRFDRVRVGSYEIYARARGSGISSATVEVIAEVTATVDLTLAHTPPPVPSLLTGTVWLQPLNDLTVVERASGARVTAIPADWYEADWPWSPPPDGTEPAILPPAPHISTQTDTDGQYRFDSLRPGKYLVLVHYPDYLPGEAWIEVPSDSETTQDFLLHPLPTGPGKVLGRVMFSPPSRASEPVPLVGAKVQMVGQNLYSIPMPIPIPYPNAESADDGTLPPEILYETQTDNRGYFEFPEVRPGYYRIQVSAEDFQTERREVDVPAGGTVALHFDLLPNLGGPEEASLEGVVWKGGSASGPDGSPEPIAGAMAIAVPLGANANPEREVVEPGDSSFLPRFTFTNERGRYRFDTLPSGGWAVTVVAEGFLPAVQRIFLEPGATGVLNFRLAPASGDGRNGLYGMISQWTPYPTFAPVPVEGAEITLVPLTPDPNIGSNGIFATKSDEQGLYRIADLPPGGYRMTVRAEGFTAMEGLDVHVPPGEKIRQDVVLYPNELGAGALHGKVMEGVGPDDSIEGNPVPGAIVRLIPDWMAVIAIFPPPDVGFDRITDESGDYSFGELPAGGYGVTVLKEGYHPTFGHIQIHSGQIHERDWGLAPLGATTGAGVSQ